MKKLSLFVGLALVLVLSFSALAFSAYPDKPITIVVYTSPGGAIDITSRLIANIAKKYVDVPVVVENKKGAGGLVATQYVLSKPADGYTIFGMTSSVISSTIKGRRKKNLDRLYYLAMMVKDYECLITNKKLKVVTFEDIVKDAKAKNGKQLWVGPAVGGTDHLFAMKVWRAVGIKARWIPFKGGSKAIAALLGGHGVVYVGNPQDTIGRPDLYVAAVASPKRLKGFEDSPTFEELGYPELTGEVLWRGYALKKGTPKDRIEFLQNLFEKVSKDPEWISFVEKGSMEPVFITGDKFAKAVKLQVLKDTAFLEAAGLIK